MSKVRNDKKTRSIEAAKTPVPKEHHGFTPCSQDMTICGDCEGNRAKNTCPRLKEWLAKRQG